MRSLTDHAHDRAFALRYVAYHRTLRWRKALIATVTLSLVLGVTLLLCEVGFRLLLFSSVAAMEKYRDPRLYADYFSDDDWWRLYYKFNKPPNHTAKYPHPLLGWHAASLIPDTYQHVDAVTVGARQPVLLYGDSFTQCSTLAGECFQDILNRDESVSKDRYLLNYGMGAYGVDQIYLLLKESLPIYEKPVVIVGIHTRDLDRSILSLFVGRKPYFDDNMVLHGTPIVQTVSDPPQIVSYLYRLWLYHGRPWKITHYLRGEEAKQVRREVVNGKLVHSIIAELGSRPSLFVIFNSREEITTLEWYEQFLTDIFTRNHVPFLSTRTIIRDDMERTGLTINDYFLTDNHPNARQNQLVAQEMKRWLHGTP